MPPTAGVEVAKLMPIVHTVPKVVIKSVLKQQSRGPTAIRAPNVAILLTLLQSLIEISYIAICTCIEISFRYKGGGEEEDLPGKVTVPSLPLFQRSTL